MKRSKKNKLITFEELKELVSYNSDTGIFIWNKRPPTCRKNNTFNTTGYKGVWKRKGMDLWVAGVSKDGKNIKLGSFDCPQKAHAAYIAEITKMHGEFVRHE